MKKKTETVQKVEVKAFINWSLAGKNGQTLRSAKGLPLFDNPEYPNPEEAVLIRLAEESGGTFEAVLKVRIVLADKSKRKPKSFNLEDFMDYGPSTGDEVLPF
jgi:hypothetical protein